MMHLLEWGQLLAIFNFGNVKFELRDPDFTYVFAGWDIYNDTYQFHPPLPPQTHLYHGTNVYAASPQYKNLLKP